MTTHPCMVSFFNLCLFYAICVSYSIVLQCQLVWMLWYMTRPADLMTVGPWLHLLCYKVSVLVNGF